MSRTDPEFVEIISNFSQDETANANILTEKERMLCIVPFPVSWTVKMKKKQKETQDILSYHTQAAGCS
ncbi:hypothetical protein JXX08_16765, partial [Ruthenibacterium lactatiformans]|nr:hypothetical protein [Ruthenibacterium lactatiformans]